MKRKCTSKVLSLILVMLMLIGMMPAVVSAAQTGETSDGYKYSISGGEVTITGYTGKSTVVNIPESIENCPVTKVSSYAFIGNTDITVVVYPKGVTAVEEISFANCKSLASVHLPDTIVTIGGSAFFGCTKLVNISIPENVEVIGNSAFQKCESLTNITLPDSVKSIGGQAFAECSKLKTINIPEGITTIAESVFEKCSSLKTVKIPTTVTSISERAFSYCSSLSDVYFGGTSKQWNAVEIGANNGYLRSATIHCQETSEEMFNIYFSNNRYWNGVYIYGYYGSDINNPTAEPLGSYPGEKMTWVRVNDYAQNEYYATVPADVDGIVFSSGDGIYRTVEIPNDVLYNNIIFYLKEKTGDYFDYGTAYYPCRETELKYVIGNANEDGFINVKDASAIMDAISGLAELSEIGRVAADVNEDGKIDILDATDIYKWIAGIDEFSLGEKEIILNTAKIPEVSVYTPEDDTDTDKPAEGIKVMDTVYNPEVGTTVTYRVNLTTEYNFDNIQASVFYDSTKLELRELRLNNKLGNLLSYSDTEGKVRFCAASVKGFDFSETADVLEIDFLVKDTDYSEIQLLMEEMWIKTVRAKEYYFSKCEANNTQHIEIVETLEFEKTEEENKEPEHTYLAGTFNGWTTDHSYEFRLKEASDTVAYVELELEANTTYKFKILHEGNWTSCKETLYITESCSGLTFSRTVLDDTTITTKDAGTYIFAFDLNTSQLSVTYPVVEDEPSSGTYRYYFYMPSDWLNESTAQTGNTAGIYWWEGTNAAEYWPGVPANKADVEGVYYYDVPMDVTTVTWNNYFDGGTDPDDPYYANDMQTRYIGTEYYDPMESPLYPKGTDDFDGMIYVIDPSRDVVNDYSGKTTRSGDWFYYYGNGEYGTAPIKGDSEILTGEYVNIDRLLGKEPENSTPDETAKILKDEKTGITVEGAGNVELEVEECSTDDEFNFVIQGGAIDRAFDITLMREGAEVQPDGTVVVRIPAEDENAKIIHISKDGTIEDMNAVYEDGFLVFETTHFSVYAILEIKVPLRYEAEYLLGDANGDGALNVKDATAIQKALAGLIELGETEQMAADVDESGMITIKDATAIQKYIADIDTGFNTNEQVNVEAEYIVINIAADKNVVLMINYSLKIGN